MTRTITTPQNKIIHRLQPKQSQEIPTQTRHPPHIQIPRAHSTLQHALELRRQRERQLHNHEPCEKRIDPPHDERLRHHHRHVALHGAHEPFHGRWIRHGVCFGLAAGFDAVGEELAVAEGGDEVLFAGEEGGGGELVEICP